MDSPLSTSRSQEYWRRWDRTFRRGLVASIILHILIVFMFSDTVTVPDLDYAAAGEDAGDVSAAAGGGLEMISLQVAQAPTEPEEEVQPVIEPEPTPEPTPEPPPEPEPVRGGSQSDGPTTTAGQGRGQDDGPGTDRGTGRGDGGTSDAGTGSISAPAPRSLILPPTDRPASVRGKTITVYAFVDVRGRVVPDSTRLDPSTGDRRFDNRLREQAAEWTFRPATLDGRPVAAWFPWVVTF